MIENPGRMHFAGLFLILFGLLPVFIGGCSKDEKPAAADSSETKPATTPVKSTQPDVAPPAANIEKTQMYLELHQPYSEAVIEATPDNVAKPDNETAAGKKTPKIWADIKGENGVGGLWEQVRFLTPQGKRIKYEAVVKTSAGEFRIALLADAAPNHVRNFIALCRAGYYDGLGVDFLLKQPEPDGNILLAGCPLSTGELGHGSIGYWLKPEGTSKYSNEEGTVGSWPLENAACKFYITTSKASWMDVDRYTIFGRVSHGMDVVRKMGQVPQQKFNGIETGFPEEPIVFEKITIVQTTE